MKQIAKRTLPVLFATCCAALAGTPANALDAQQYPYLLAGGDVPWQSLSPDEQKALEEYKLQWNDFDTSRQKRIRDGAQRYLSLPPDQRKELDKQQKRYEQLSPEEQKRLKQQYQHDTR